jgi:hypothetical protein
MTPIKPLKPQFKPEYGIFSKDEIIERVRSEDNFTNAKNYPLTFLEDNIDILCPRIKRVS